MSLMKDVDYADKRSFEEEMAELESPTKLRPHTGPRETNHRHFRAERSKNIVEEASIRRAVGVDRVLSGRSTRRRRGFLSPDPDESEGDGRATSGVSHEDGQEANRVGGAAVKTSSLRAPATHISRDRRRIILSPDPDESDDIEEAPNGISHEDGQNVKEVAVETSILRAAAAQVPRKRKRVLSEPEIKTEEQDIIVIEDDVVVKNTGPVATRDTQNAITVVDDDMDEDKKHIVLITNDDEDDIDVKPVAGATEQPSVVNEDMEDMEFEMEKAEIKQAQLQARLEVVQLKQKMAAAKKRKVGK